MNRLFGVSIISFKLGIGSISSILVPVKSGTVLLLIQCYVIDYVEVGHYELVINVMKNLIFVSNQSLGT